MGMTRSRSECRADPGRAELHPESPLRRSSTMDSDPVNPHNLTGLFAHGSKGTDSANRGHACLHSPKDRVVGSDVAAASQNDEEVAPRLASCFLVGLSHCHGSNLIVEVSRRRFDHAIARAGGSIALRIATLDHKVRGHPVEVQPVVEARASKVDEGVHHYRKPTSVKPDLESAAVGLDDRNQVIAAVDCLWRPTQVLNSGLNWPYFPAAAEAGGFGPRLP
jgi:hypothetical protein